MADYNDEIIAEFRANGGKVGGPFGGMELLLLHSTGAKSGKEYVKPVAYTTDGDRLVVIASKGGAPTHPSWYYNLLAHPDTVVEVGSDKFPVHAVLTEGAETDRLYDQHAKVYPGFNEYKLKTTRQIPVFLLERVS